MVRATVPTREAGTIPTVKGVNRREFLSYLLGGSAALLFAEAGSAALWFAEPYRFGPNGGLFIIDAGKLSLPRTSPVIHKEGWFWLSNTDKGLLALDGKCPYDALHFVWVAVNNRFECPLCGSKFQADGTYISGPAGRGLDRFVITVFTPHGRLKTPSDGGQVSLQDATSITVDAIDRIFGRPHG